jgi:aldehyde:ferredoxin oxidoreductase
LCTAGENSVHYAFLIRDEVRAAGKMGVGKLEGSKQFKAVAVKEDERTSILLLG